MTPGMTGSHVSRERVFCPLARVPASVVVLHPRTSESSDRTISMPTASSCAVLYLSYQWRDVKVLQYPIQKKERPCGNHRTDKVDRRSDGRHQPRCVGISHRPHRVWNPCALPMDGPTAERAAHGAAFVIGRATCRARLQTAIEPVKSRSRAAESG